MSDTSTAVPATSDAETDLKVENLIKNHVMAASAAAIVPLPLFDVAAITVVQMRMVAKLAAIYGKTFSERAARNSIVSLVGGVFGHVGGVFAAMSLIKFVPGIGTILGMVSLPTMAGATTYALGRVFAKHFRNGGSLFDISVSGVSGYYNEQVEKGKKIADDLRSRPSGQSA